MKLGHAAKASITPHQADLFDVKAELLLPRRLELTSAVHGNPVQGFAFLEHKRSVYLSKYQKSGVTGHVARCANDEAIFIGAKTTNATVPGAAVLVIPGAADATGLTKAAQEGKAHWHRPKPTSPPKEDTADSEARCAAITKSWEGQFVFREEDRESGPPVKGLRRPQIGALYAALAHWSVSEDPATIVMPTGTGKTETMLALLVCARLPRLMIVVPNKPLRDQIADKFLTLGKLIECGCLQENARPPVVATLRRRPSTPQEVDDIFCRANVIVAIMSVAGQCSAEVQDRMAELCSHLFIDEAHHIAARTWAEFRRRFRQRPLLQFTATPFRMDGKRIDGRYIYTYPLARAQREGYFRTVNFVAVIEYDDADADDAIAARAGQQLRKDREAGLDHLLMARVKTTDRADEILKLYDSRFPEFEAVAIHTVSDISAYGTDWGDCVTEDFWLIVVTEGNEDEAEIGEFEKRCRDGRAGYPA